MKLRLPNFIMKPFLEFSGIKLEDSSSKTSTFADGRIEPPVKFKLAQEYYCSSPRIFNVVESTILEVINRHWYYDGDEKLAKILTNWEKTAKLKDIFKYLLRNWLVCGVQIVSPKDWKGLQLSTIIAKRRDKFGNTIEYIQIRDGQEFTLPAADFIELPFIQMEREPWGFGQFHSLFFKDYVDVDGKDPRAIVELHRQTQQDTMKIHHKFASPRVFYNIPNVDKKVLDDDIVPVIEGMGQGDRAVFNTEVTPVLETVDTTSRFNDSVLNIGKEMDIGTQSSRNRKIAEPSAMADAESASRDDDDRTMGIMEDIKKFMDEIVIPKVLGVDDPNELPDVEFKWGAKDRFDLEYPDGMSQAIKDGVINVRQASKMLQDQFRWKIPTPDELKDDDDASSLPELPSEIPVEVKQIANEKLKELKTDRDVKEKLLEILEKIT